MSLLYKKLLPGSLIFVLLLLLAACTSAGNPTGNSSNGQQGTTSTATALPTITPITPKSVSGSPGIGPIVISSPTAVPGQPGSQQIVLADRTLIINSVSEQKGTSTNSTLVSLALTIRNTSAKTIMNQSTFFELLASEGDAFGSPSSNSDSFYSTIAAHTTRSGTIVFQVPTAAASGLSLFYRPEIATETVIVRLKIS